MVFAKTAITLMLIGLVTLGVLFVITLLLLSAAGRAILAFIGAIAFLAWEGRHG